MDKQNTNQHSYSPENYNNQKLSLSAWLKSFRMHSTGDFVNASLEIPGIEEDNYMVLVEDNALLLEVKLAFENSDPLFFGGEFTIPGLTKAKLISQKVINGVLSLVFTDADRTLPALPEPGHLSLSLPYELPTTTSAQMN